MKSNTNHIVDSQNQKRLFGIPFAYSLSILIVSFALLISGCADLGGVREFASLSASITGSSGISERWRDTETRLKKIPQQGDTPIDIKTGDRSEIHKETEKILLAVTTYMEVMGQLAANELPSVDTQVQSLSTALNALPGTPISESQVRAVSTLTSLISKPLDAYRHLKVRQLIETADPHLQKIITGLIELANIYRADLALERKTVMDWANLETAGDTGTPAAFLAKRYVADISRKYDEIDQGIAAYIKALQTISAKHESLVNGLATNETISRTLAQLKIVRKDLIEARDKIRNALAQKV